MSINAETVQTEKRHFSENGLLRKKDELGMNALNVRKML